MDSSKYNKPGWKTTEFWTMICSAFFGVLILTGIVTNFESNTMLAYINNIMGTGLTIISTASYMLSRGKAKQKNVNYELLIEDIKRIVDSANKQDT